MSQDKSRATIGHTTAESTPHWPAPVSAPAGAPNVIYIVFDDLGFADLGCYGSEIETPHIDALAAGGLRYTNFHTTALCSPTRAALLTGRNHHSVGMGGLADWDLGFPGMRGRISRSAGTLAEMLRLQGYNTFARPRRLAPSTSGRCSAASIASMVSWRARPASGIRSSPWTTTTSRPRTARVITCPRTLSTPRSTSSAPSR